MWRARHSPARLNGYYSDIATRVFEPATTWLSQLQRNKPFEGVENVNTLGESFRISRIFFFFFWVKTVAVLRFGKFYHTLSIETVSFFCFWEIVSAGDRGKLHRRNLANFLLLFVKIVAVSGFAMYDFIIHCKLKLFDTFFTLLFFFWGITLELSKNCIEDVKVYNAIKDTNFSSNLFKFREFFSIFFCQNPRSFQIRDILTYTNNFLILLSFFFSREFFLGK